MIVGNGQIANIFKTCELPENVVIFASGVSNSCCTDIQEFNREEEMLTHTLKNLNGNKVVYFSSCALSAENYTLSPYYQHKKNMESLVKTYTKNYYIFRVPQLFGHMKKHPTLINFIYFAIKEKKEFIVHDGAYRYLIEISDLKTIVSEYVKVSQDGIILDIANSYRYSILDIVKEIEMILATKANYKIFKIEDAYSLNLSKLETFIDTNGLEVKFGRDYLASKLRKAIIL